MNDPAVGFVVDVTSSKPSWSSIEPAPFDGPLHGGLSTSLDDDVFVAGTVCDTRITVESDADCGQKTFEVASYNLATRKWTRLPVTKELSRLSSFANVTQIAVGDSSYVVVSGIFGGSFSRAIVDRTSGANLGTATVSEAAQVCSTASSYVAVDEPPVGFTRDPAAIPLPPERRDQTIGTPATVLTFTGDRLNGFDIAVKPDVPITVRCGPGSVSVLARSGESVDTYDTKAGTRLSTLKPDKPVSDILTTDPVAAVSPLDGNTYVLRDGLVASTPMPSSGAVVAGKNVGILVTGFSPESGTDIAVFDADA